MCTKWTSPTRRSGRRGRERINDWVSDATGDLIEELIPESALSDATRMVLVNALHLKAAWSNSLSTTGGTSTTSAGEEVSAEMLTGGTSSWYEDDLCRATSVDTYGDDLALALVQPVEDLASVLDAWADAADDGASGLAALLAGLESSDAATEVTLPGFDIEWGDSLKHVLQGLGMEDPFTDAADFSGITAQEQLMITDVLQKAVITVDEDGMEAAAATGVIADTTSAQTGQHELILDSPFLVVAYERTTQAPLVAGWIGDPRRRADRRPVTPPGAPVRRTAGGPLLRAPSADPRDRAVGEPTRPRRRPRGEGWALSHGTAGAD